MKSDFFQAMNDLEDKYVLDALPKKMEKNKYTFYFGLPKKITCAVAAFSMFLILMITIGAMNPVFAKKLPFIGSVFHYIQNEMDFAGLYDNYADEIGEQAENNKISVCISEIYCDGNNLFLSYRIESEIPFKDYVDKEYVQSQMDYTNIITIKDFPELRLNDYGIRGLEGKFLDDYTFAGAETYSLGEMEFPDSFTLDISINSWILMLMDGSEYSILGNWKFSIPVTVNKKDINTISVGMSNQGHSIDKVVVSPVMITIFTSYPDVYGDSVNYEVLVFSDLSDQDITFAGVYDSTEGISKIPRSWVGNVLDIYVLDHSSHSALGAEGHLYENIKKYAIVHTQIDLQ